jgi:hypothetical protein
VAGSVHRAWPSGEDYHYLDAARRSDLAWEWLRRHPDFRKLAPSASQAAAGGIAIVEAAPPACAARWGCLHVPDPGLRFTDTPVLWSADVDPSVLRVIASPAQGNDRAAFDLLRWGAAATLVIGLDGREFLLLRQPGRGDLRIDVLSGSLRDGPVSLLHDFGGLADVEPALGALRRCLILCQTGDLPAVRLRASQGLRRQIQALRVHDALAQGGSIRDIGILLFGCDRIRQEWPGPGDALKSQCRRLIMLSRLMVDGGYKMLLR